MQVDFQGDVEGAFGIPGFPLLKGFHGLGEHLGVQVESNALDVSALGISQDFTGAPDFQIL